MGAKTQPLLRMKDHVEVFVTRPTFRTGAFVAPAGMGWRYMYNRRKQQSRQRCYKCNTQLHLLEGIKWCPACEAVPVEVRSGNKDE